MPLVWRIRRGDKKCDTLKENEGDSDIGKKVIVDKGKKVTTELSKPIKSYHTRGAQKEVVE